MEKIYDKDGNHQIMQPLRSNWRETVLHAAVEADLKQLAYDRK
jgi:hypothetical protein